MFRVCLLNMPFAGLSMPSIALNQLKSVTDDALSDRVSVEIIDINQDFAQDIGISLYGDISFSAKTLYAGFGDWYFRQAAFPSAEDNTESYVKRFMWGRDELTGRLKELIRVQRPKLSLYLDKLIAKYNLSDASLVGFTSMFMQNVPSFAMARKLKSHNPQITTVLGGANCEYPMGSVVARKVDCIDYVFSGPALKSFPEFLQKLIEGDEEGCSTIRGVFHKRTSLSKASSECYGEELSIDFPIHLDYDDFLNRFEADYANDTISPVLPFETSRGCWWGQRSHCTFCGLNGATMTFRAMKPEVAIKQFRSLFRYAGRTTSLQAVDNILPKNYLTDVLPSIETPKDLEIFYEVKADLSEADLITLARAGVKSIQPGIESIATSTLKLMKKGTSSYQNVKFLKNCTFLKIRPTWNLLVGFPGEDKEVYQRYKEVIPLLTHLEPPSGVFPVRFDRYSPYYTRSNDYLLNLRPMDFYTYAYPFSEEEIANLAYYFVDSNILAQYQQTMIEMLGDLTHLVDAWKEQWNKHHSGTKPQLYLMDDQQGIYDSRFKETKEHLLSDEQINMLTYLEQPCLLEDCVRKFSHLSEPKALAVIAELESRGLLFKEGERFLSLVMKKNPDTYTLPYVAQSTSDPARSEAFRVLSH
jgi:ribosomal peptide maturation radical SAM protein 1